MQVNGDWSGYRATTPPAQPPIRGVRVGIATVVAMWALGVMTGTYKEHLAGVNRFYEAYVLVKIAL